MQRALQIRSKALGPLESTCTYCSFQALSAITPKAPHSSPYACVAGTLCMRLAYTLQLLEVDQSSFRSFYGLVTQTGSSVHPCLPYP